MKKFIYILAVILLVGGCSTSNTKNKAQKVVFECPNYVYPYFDSYYQDGDLKVKKSYKLVYDEKVEEISYLESLKENCLDQTNFYDNKDTYGDYNLFSPLDLEKIFLLDMQGQVVKEWETDYIPTNDVSIMPDGRFLGLYKSDENIFDPMAGQGGTTQIINQQGEVDWNFNYFNENYTTHHDVELLPNGNILMLVWNSHSLAEAEAKGFEAPEGVEFSSGLWFEKIVEVDPDADKIVWSWDSFDYTQKDPSGYLIDVEKIKPHPRKPGDIMHANGLEYDEENDLIFMTVNAFDQIWVIDHDSGDIVYSFGENLFNAIHHPNLLDNGNIMVFENGDRGSENPYSTIYEIKLPEDFSSEDDIEVVWSFRHPDLFSGYISGATRLPNGNTLIAEGDFGFWEINKDKEIVWQYHYNALYPEKARFGIAWRPYRYTEDSPEIINLFE